MMSIMEDHHYTTFLSSLCIVFIFHIHFVFTNDVAAGTGRCIGRERRALLEFKGSLVDSANRLSSWTGDGDGDDCCNWVGITCNNLTGHVEKLDLHNPILPDLELDFSGMDDYSNNCLGGEINPSICDLEYLLYLDLSSNDFLGIPIPAFFGFLRNLIYLNLSSSGFNWEIPPHLGNLSNLQYLDVGESNGMNSNYLSAMNLKWIKGLSSLKVLDLSGTNLSESFDWLYSMNMLPFLSSLNLWGCELAVGTISPSLFQFNLTSLVSLDMGMTHLNTYPSVLRFFDLTASKLEVLRLDHNDWESPFPFMLEKSTSLTVLDLSLNSFNSSSMLHSLCNHTSLVYVDLSYNEFGGSFPPCIGNLTSLVYVDLSNNKFGGSLPPCLGNLTSLEEFRLENNQFGGEIPNQLGDLIQLTHLSLSSNSFNSSIPSSFGKLTNLQVLDLYDNGLSGELSEFLFMKLKSIKFLYLSNNPSLTLNVSSQWIPPFQLRWLEMNSINIGAQFPPWLQTQRNLYSLSIENASISAIPEWFGTICSSLNSLDLSFNFLTGIPESLGTSCSNLQILNLASNMIHGSSSGNLLYSLCNSSSLTDLNLANNQLTGSIPPCLGNLEGLQFLNLANNSLSGNLPSTLGNLNELQSLHLNGNNFEGVLPSSLKNLKVLVTLDLGENQFEDIIPDWIGKELPILMYLRLESNKFYGNISSSLCNSPSLQLLNLAHNNLGGNIPRCLGNLSGMLQPNGEDGTLTPPYYTDSISNTIKGMELEYTPTNIHFVKSISLSGNELHGEIPNELMDLGGLQSLNLSNNNLSGNIPENIDNMKQMESLDLSMNQLSGPIPQSLATIDALSYLNLSFNNLEGRIPSGNHFDTLSDPSIYEGNSGLCGEPLTKKCPGDDSPSKENGLPGKRIDDDTEFEFEWFYTGLGPGFAVGLLGVVCVLLFKKSWRYAYFRFMENSYERLWVVFAVKISQFKRK